MTSHDVQFGGSGIPETVIPAENVETLDALAAAIGTGDGVSRDALVAVVSANPRSLFAWAALGDAGRDVMESYSAYRVGYHRGLDILRQSGWRGSGYVRWEHPSNQGFLRCLAGLQLNAEAISETDEAERCALFLRQLEPSWPPADFG